MIYIILSVLILCADFFTKLLVRNGALTGETLMSIPGIVDVTYVQNSGAAFSMMSGKTVFLSLLSAGFCVFVIIYVIKAKPQSALLKTALAMMLAGALGNGIDRVCYGFVVDFIRVRFIDFPVFNIADTAITVGAALVVIYIAFFDKSKSKEGGGE